MKNKRIFCVGFDLPGEEFEYIQFDSDQSLLDADIVLFQPSFGDKYPSESYQGHDLFSHSSSVEVTKYLQHWRSELSLAVNSGKLVIIFLTKPSVHYKYTGQAEVTGTGRSRSTTNYVSEISTYSTIPIIKSAEAKSGHEIRLTKDGQFLSNYWKEFGDFCPYETFIDGQFGKILLTTKTGGKIVGASVQAKGVLLFLPPIRYDEEKFSKYDAKKEESFWTAEAMKFGKRLAATLISLSNSLLSGAFLSPPPLWADNIKFRLPQEVLLEREIAKVAAAMKKLHSEREVLEADLQKAGGCRALLYEQGKALESAVVDALTTMGFTAKNYNKGDSEFDVIFEALEGRCLGEVEGKDSRSINVDKFSQLERNLQEDFAREDVQEYAKGVLFGNPERLIDLESRGEAFTAKCVSAAKRAHVALVRIPDLFNPIRYLKTHPDPDFATACRKAIFASDGIIVEFPVPPINLETTTTET